MFRTKTLPAGLAKLIALAQAVPEKTDAARKEVTSTFLDRVEPPVAKRLCATTNCQIEDNLSTPAKVQFLSG